MMATSKFVEDVPELLLPPLRSIAAELTIDDYVVLILLLFGASAYLTRGKLWAKPDPYRYKLFERPQEKFAPAKRNERSRNIAQQLEHRDKDAVIFWGSQSGTAEGLANRLARDCNQRFGLDTIVADLSDYDHETICQIPQTKFVLFLVSTYGEGDPSDNTTEFLAWLQKPSTGLANVRYAAFGLGNSNYVYYNKVVDDMVRLLDQHSASSLMPVGKADDANSGTEEDFASWRDDLFVMFQTKLAMKERTPEYKPSIIVTRDVLQGQSTPQTGEPKALKLSRKTARDYTAVKSLPLKEARILTSNQHSSRSCFHFEIDIRAHPQLKYKTGDHLAIWPTNSSGEVNRLLQVLDLQDKTETEIRIAAQDATAETRVPAHTTIQALFQHYLEISAPVSRDTVFTLSQFATAPNVKSFLQGLATKSGYANFVSNHYITLGRLLELSQAQDPTSNWKTLPLAFVIESLRPMTPRYYSISSSSMISPRQMSITVAVSPVEVANNPSVTIPGLTTSYLAELDINATPNVFSHIRRSTFKMPFLHKTPIVLIAAGTGIAPFRAFLQERAQMAQISNQEIGPVLLIFGCRNAEEDYIYKAELEAIQNGPLRGKFGIVTAFSRVPGEKKVYVQDRLAEPDVQAKVLQYLCEREGNLYFCGSTTMAKTAGRTLVDAIRQKNEMSESESKGWMDDMKRSRRWQEDVWG